MHDPEISIVLLGYRAGESLRTTIPEICSLMETRKLEYEIILVANYSDETDPTPHIAREIAAVHPRVKTSTLKKEGMFGWDMKSGLVCARGHYIAVIDGDGQMPFQDIVRVYDAARSHNAPLAKTYRTIRNDDSWRTVVSYAYNILFRVLFPGLKAHDLNSKPKIFTREAYQEMKLTSDDWFIDAEIMLHARRHGWQVVEVPTVFNTLVGRKSFVKPVTILEFMRNLVIFRIREFRL